MMHAKSNRKRFDEEEEEGWPVVSGPNQLPWEKHQGKCVLQRGYCDWCLVKA